MIASRMAAAAMGSATALRDGFLRGTSPLHGRLGLLDDLATRPSDVAGVRAGASPWPPGISN